MAPHLIPSFTDNAKFDRLRTIIVKLTAMNFPSLSAEPPDPPMQAIRGIIGWQVVLPPSQHESCVRNSICHSTHNSSKIWRSPVLHQASRCQSRHYKSRLARSMTQKLLMVLKFLSFDHRHCCIQACEWIETHRNISRCYILLNIINTVPDMWLLEEGFGSTDWMTFMDVFKLSSFVLYLVGLQIIKSEDNVCQISLAIWYQQLLYNSAQTENVHFYSLLVLQDDYFVTLKVDLQTDISCAPWFLGVVRHWW